LIHYNDTERKHQRLNGNVYNFQWKTNFKMQPTSVKVIFLSFTKASTGTLSRDGHNSK
jgi:hypothetical protein